jgi:hypothetical protein
MENYYYSACFFQPVIKRSMTVTIALAAYDGKWFQDLLRLALESKHICCMVEGKGSAIHDYEQYGHSLLPSGLGAPRQQPPPPTQ